MKSNNLLRSLCHLLIALCVAVLSSPSIAGASWDETVGWIAGKLVNKPYWREGLTGPSIFTVTAVSGDGCNLLISEQWDKGYGDVEPKPYLAETQKIPMKDYFEIKAGNFRPWSSFALEGSYLRISSRDENIELKISHWKKGSYGKAKHETYSQVGVYFPVDAYPDFVERMDNALSRLAHLARANPECGKRDLY